MAGDLGIILALLRRMVNYHDSWIHRLPPEMLVAVASHLEDNASLVSATHVCHLWRMALLSSRHLWSHLDFANEERALVFLGGSKSAPLSVDLTGIDDPSEIVRESLKEITTRVTTLRAVHNYFLDQLMAQPMTTLEVLEISYHDYNVLPPDEPTRLPSLTSLVISCFDPLRFRAPALTSFHLESTGSFLEQDQMAGSLVDFLRNCPLLEVIFISCGIQDNTHPDFDATISLPFLRSFTHESPGDQYQLCLFNRLSLPSTCRVALAIDVTEDRSYPWISGLPTPRDPSFLSDIKPVKIAAHTRNIGARKNCITFKVELTSSTRGTISFNRISRYSKHPPVFSHKGFLDILGSLKLKSVGTLSFDCFPVFQDRQPRAVAESVSRAMGKFWNLKTVILVGSNIILSLDNLDLSSCPAIDALVFSSRCYRESLYEDVICRLRDFAESRKKAGTPLKTLTIVYLFAGLRPSEVERLVSYVGSVEVLSVRDAFKWDMNEYLLRAATHEGNAGGF